MKKIILILSTILVFLIILTTALNNLLKTKNSQSNNSLLITTYPHDFSSVKNQVVSQNQMNYDVNNSLVNNPKENNQEELTKQINQPTSSPSLLQSTNPTIFNPKIQNQAAVNSLTNTPLSPLPLTTKSANNNNSNNNPSISSYAQNAQIDSPLALITNTSISPSINRQKTDTSQPEIIQQSLDYLKDYFDLFSGMTINNNQPSLNLSPSPKQTNSQNKSKNTATNNQQNNQKIKDISTIKTYGGLVYYSQCNSGYNSYSLPDGCTICYAGCGPTSVAMLLSSFINKNYTPPKVVDLYKQNNQSLGCGGSYYSSAKLILEKYGLKTTDYITYNLTDAHQVAPDFKRYLDAGWVMFVLANFEKTGHFFIVTAVKNGEIMAFDPYYGSNQSPPINQNRYYPYPKYRIAFGVKK